MTSDLYRASNAAIRRAYADQLGTTPDAFDGETLTVVERPPTPDWPFTAIVVSFGTGTVIGVEPSFRETVLAEPPRRHYDTFEPSFLGRLVEEGRRREMPITASAPGMGWALAQTPEPQPLPNGYAIEERDAAWMAAQQPASHFENSVGEPGDEDRTERNRFARVLVAPDGEIAAVAGVFDSFGLLEIGIDVAREHRGRGLAPIAVRAAAAAILGLGETPYYICAATNTRSQRTAMASGFVPVCSMAYVGTPPGPDGVWRPYE